MNRILTDERGIAPVVIVLIVLGVVIVGVAAAGAVILSNDLTITVENRSCGTLDIAEGSAGDKEDAVIDYVLSEFTPEEKKVIKKTIPVVSQAILCLLTEGLTAAMNKYN